MGSSEARTAATIMAKCTLWGRAPKPLSSTSATKVTWVPARRIQFERTAKNSRRQRYPLSMLLLQVQEQLSRCQWCTLNQIVYKSLHWKLHPLECQLSSGCWWDSHSQETQLTQPWVTHVQTWAKNCLDDEVPSRYPVLRSWSDMTGNARMGGLRSVTCIISPHWLAPAAATAADIKFVTRLKSRKC